MLTALLPIFTLSLQALPVEPGNQPDPSEIEITDANGNALPADVHAQIRKARQAQAVMGKARPRKATSDNGDIVVSGIRQRGAVPGDIPPERVFDAADLESLGANDVDGLIKALAPRLQGQVSDSPVALLINGKRTGSYSDILTYPADAIERVEVLPEASASSFGFSGNQKVINIITFERFRQLASTAAVQTRLRKGGGGLKKVFQAFAITGERRANLLAKIEHDDSLLYRDVGISSLSGRPISPSPSRRSAYGQAL